MSPPGRVQDPFSWHYPQPLGISEATAPSGGHAVYLKGPQSGPPFSWPPGHHCLLPSQWLLQAPAGLGWRPYQHLPPSKREGQCPHRIILDWLCCKDDTWYLGKGEEQGCGSGVPGRPPPTAWGPVDGGPNKSYVHSRGGTSHTPAPAGSDSGLLPSTAPPMAFSPLLPLRPLYGHYPRVSALKETWDSLVSTSFPCLTGSVRPGEGKGLARLP